MARLSVTDSSRGANYVHIRNHITAIACDVRTLMFGVSDSGPATSFARRAVEAKVRTAWREEPEARTAAPNGRPTASRIAILCGERVVRLRDVAGEGDCGW